MRRFVLILALLLLYNVTSATDTPPPAPTETPAPSLTPTITPTPTAEPWVYATIPPADDPEAEGTQTRFDYIISVGDVMISVLLLALLVSNWMMFVYYVVRDGDA